MLVPLGVKGHEPCHENIHSALRLVSVKFLEPSPGNDAAPVGQVIDLIHLDTNLRVLAQHVELQSRDGVAEKRTVGIHVGDRHNVCSSPHVATDSGHELGFKQTLDLAGG